MRCIMLHHFVSVLLLLLLFILLVFVKVRVVHSPVTKGVAVSHLLFYAVATVAM